MLSSQVQEEQCFLTKKSNKIYQCVDVLICQYDNGAKIKIISQLANVSITHWLIANGWKDSVFFTNRQNDYLTNCLAPSKVTVLPTAPASCRSPNTSIRIDWLRLLFPKPITAIFSAFLIVIICLKFWCKGTAIRQEKAIKYFKKYT